MIKETTTVNNLTFWNNKNEPFDSKYKITFSDETEDRLSIKYTQPLFIPYGNI